MRVWAVANQKGGVGKTTTAVSMGGLLASRGYRVLLVDLDSQGSMTTYFGYDPDIMAHSTYDLFQHKGKVPADLPTSLVKTTGCENLSLIPASTALAALERQLVGQDGMGLVISKSLAILWEDYDYVLIDSPPILGVLMINALAACEQLLIPVQTEFLAIKGLERMMRTLMMVMKSRSQPLSYTVIPTMFDRRTQASVSSLRTLKNSYGEHIWASAIPVDTRFRDASKAGKPPHLLDPNSRGVSAYESLLKIVLEKGRGVAA